MEIIRGKIPCAKKVVIYGPEGIGKSTFAAQFPDPVFIDTEGSTKDMDVARFEKPSSWPMLMEQVRYVKANPSICKTLIIDTADWAEQMCVADVCARYGKRGVEDFGYGNGYVYAKEEFGRFLNALEEVVEASINVVLTAHAQLRKFEQPDELGAYDRWEMKLGKKTSSQTTPLVKEWADMVLFANYKTWTIATDDKGKKHKAQGGARVMYTAHHPCWDAKNRYGLPDEVPFEYDQIRHIIEDAASAQIVPRVMEQVQATTDLPKDQQALPAENIPDSSVAANPVQQAMDFGAETGEKKEGNDFMDIPPSPGDDIWTPDSRIPKSLRDLMIANHVCEWDIQNAVIAKGHFPDGMEVWEYPQDYIDGVLVGAWDQVYAVIKEMKEKEAVPFN